jgi:biopolymer transport protein ExbB/TolQ
MLALGFTLVWLMSTVVGLGGTAWLIRRSWRQSKPASLGLKLASTFVATSALVGAVGACAGVVKAFGAVGGESLDPSQKARVLAQGIAEAMNWTAFGIVVWLPSTLALLLLTRPRKDRSPT